MLSLCINCRQARAVLGYSLVWIVKIWQSYKQQKSGSCNGSCQCSLWKSHRASAQTLRSGPKIAAVPSYFLLWLLLMISHGWGGCTALYKKPPKQWDGFSYWEADVWEEEVLHSGRTWSWCWKGQDPNFAPDVAEALLFFCCQLSVKKIKIKKKIKWWAWFPWYSLWP